MKTFGPITSAVQLWPQHLLLLSIAGYTPGEKMGVLHKHLGKPAVWQKHSTAFVFTQFNNI